MASGDQRLRNTVLTQMPSEEFQQLQPHLEPIDLVMASELALRGEPLEHVVFLISGIASMLVESLDGRSVEVGITGRESMVGLPIIAGIDEQLSFDVVVQIPGQGLQVPARTMVSLLPSLPSLREILIRRLAVQSLFLAQNAGCNRLHSVEQRLSRWLSIVRDRLETDVIHITHDFLSRMVGTDRASVTTAVAQLDKLGILERRHRLRGSLTIKSREKLEQHSCECYGLFRRFNRQLGLIPESNRPMVA
jgi:CRP-like cAMP-binding protein